MNDFAHLFGLPKFELPKFDLTTFDLPKFDPAKLEMPAGFRELTKESYDKAKTLAEESADRFEDAYTAATTGLATYNLKVIAAARTNSAAAFNYVGELLEVTSVSDFVELFTAHARKQFETLTGQTKDLVSLAQKVAAETVEPLKFTAETVLGKAA